MKNFFLLALISCALLPNMLSAQTARQVLDRTAATVGVNDGVKASFTISIFNGSQSSGSTSGTLQLKGNKFHAVTPQAIVWFDGKTEWTYMKKNDEVNVSNPTAAQLEQMNPYHFINIYKSGYSLKMKSENLRGRGVYEIHMKAQDKQREIQQVLISVDKNSYQPLCVRMLQGKKKWTVISIKDFASANIPDDIFRFDSKDFPKAEVIDLR